MKKISSLSKDSFNISGELNTRMPKFNNNLIAHFPMDGTLENCINSAEIYVEGSAIKTRGIIPNILKLNSNVSVSNNAMVFSGNSNCFLDLNPDILNNANDFEVEIKFIETAKSSTLNCILHAGRNESGVIENEFSIISRKNENYLYCDIQNRTPDSTLGDINAGAYSITNPGDINLNEAYIIKIVRKNNMLVTYLNDVFKNIYRIYGNLKVHRLIIGQENDSPVTGNNFYDTESFRGKIEYIKFKRFEYINRDTVTPEVTKFGLTGSDSSKNICKDTLSIYNNLKVPATLVNTNSKFLNYPIKRLTMAIANSNELDYIKNGSGAFGVFSYDSYAFKANTKYCSYIFFKPISHKDLVLQGNASNSGAFIRGKVIELSYGWHMYYQYTTGHPTEKYDKIFFSLKSSLLKLNEEAIIEVSPIIILEGKETPGHFNINYNQTIEGVPFHCDIDKYINPIINDFSIGFNWTPLAHTTDYTTPHLCSLGSWTDNNSQDWIGIYRGKGWGENILNISTVCLSSNSRIEIASISNFNTLIGHKLYIGISYNKTNKKIVVIVYDKTTNSYIIKKEVVNNILVFNSFKSWIFNYYTGDLTTNLSIYNKALAINEFEQNYINKFSIEKDGSIFLDRLSETIPTISKDNVYYAPLDISTNSICGRLKKANIDQEPSYINGASLTGDIKADLIIDLTRNQSESSQKITNVGWNAYLHEDACNLTGWATGYNSDVENNTIGYHAKWVKEGPTGQICGKFIDCNNQYSNKNRWLGLSRNIAVTEFGLWNSCIIGDKITISFKAKADKKDSIIQIGLYRKQKSTNTNGFGPQTIKIKIDTTWKEYSHTFIIDSDWNLSEITNLYFHGNINKFETVSWFTDVVLIKNGPINISSEVAYNLKEGQGIEYNLNRDIGLKWNEPWQICYFKKPISSSKITLYSLDSIGCNSPGENKGYGYFGNGNAANALVHSFYNNSTSINSSSKEYSNNSYYNNWIFVSIKYDGTKITCEEYGKDINFKSSFNYTIPNATFYNISSLNKDLTLGGYSAPSIGLNSSGSLYKDLIILKNQYLNDKETLKLSQIKMSYKNNKLIANCEFTEYI